MQVVGASLAGEGISAVASRSSRPQVRAWAERVLARHVRRSPELMERVANARRLEAIMESEKLPSEARARIRAAFDAGEPFYCPSGQRILAFLRRAADTMDYVESLPDSDRRIRRIDRMAWGDADALAAAWHAAILKHGRKIRDLVTGTRRNMEFEGGAFVAELATEKALRAEGAAMGHCVGGYWGRVSSGNARILSVRDSEGRPHVTIELARAHTVEVEGIGVVSLANMPRHGRDVVREAAGGWVAVQVRGKQNKEPIEKWRALLVEWLDETGTEWQEYGAVKRPAAGREFVTYRVGEFFASDPDAAAARFEIRLLEAIAGRPEAFGELYARSGLHEVHGCCADKARVLKACESYLPMAMAAMSVMLEGRSPFKLALHRSGAGALLRRLGELGAKGGAAQRRILEIAMSTDAPSATEQVSQLVSAPGCGSLSVVRHALPLQPLLMLSQGVVAGLEDEVAAAIFPALADTLVSMMNRPGDLHGVYAASGGVMADDIVRGYLLCGLAAEYGAALAAVEAGVKSRVRDMRLTLKKTRTRPDVDPSALNLASNVLSDGYEARLVEMARSRGGAAVLVFAPTAARPADPVRRSEEPVVKQYKAPAAHKSRR